jgi:hypothetical protein
MTIQEDNKLDPNNKARWGFAGTEGKITVGPQTVGETGGVDTARTPVDEKGGRGNGGGADVDALNSQVSDLQSQLDQARIELDAERAKNSQATAGASSGTGLQEGGSATDPRDSLTIPEIKAQLDGKEVKYSSTANKAELLELLKAQE